MNEITNTNDRSCSPACGDSHILSYLLTLAWTDTITPLLCPHLCTLSHPPLGISLIFLRMCHWAHRGPAESHHQCPVPCRTETMLLIYFYHGTCETYTSYWYHVSPIPLAVSSLRDRELAAIHLYLCNISNRAWHTVGSYKSVLNTYIR